MRCKFCGHTTSNVGGFCRECVAEGFVTVYHMTGKRSNGWEWAERNAAAMRARARIAERPQDWQPKTWLISKHVRAVAV